MPFFLSDQSDVLIQVYRDLIGYIEGNGQLNNMAAGGINHQTLLNEVGGVWTRDYYQTDIIFFDDHEAGKCTNLLE